MNGEGTFSPGVSPSCVEPGTTDLFLVGGERV